MTGTAVPRATIDRLMAFALICGIGLIFVSPLRAIEWAIIWSGLCINETIRRAAEDRAAHAEGKE